MSGWMCCSFRGRHGPQARLLRPQHAAASLPRFPLMHADKVLLQGKGRATAKLDGHQHDAEVQGSSLCSAEHDVNRGPSH